MIQILIDDVYLIVLPASLVVAQTEANVIAVLRQAGESILDIDIDLHYAERIPQQPVIDYHPGHRPCWSVDGQPRTREVAEWCLRQARWTRDEARKLMYLIRACARREARCRIN